MSPRFSIVTVVLNPPIEDLLLTVASVISQRERDWELIIKDGGSDPRCLASIQSDPRIRVVTSKDSGIFDAMNQAIDLASGQFICFLNAGDFFHDSSALSHVSAGIDSTPGADFVYGDVAKPSSRSGFERYADVLTRSYLFRRMICHQAWFVTRKFYGKTERYETKLPTGADRRFLLQMVLRDKVNYKHVKHVLVSYKGGGVSVRPELIRSSRAWEDEMVRSLYSPLEYFMFSGLKLTLNAAREVMVRSGAWKFWLCLRRFSN